MKKRSLLLIALLSVCLLAAGCGGAGDDVQASGDKTLVPETTAAAQTTASTETTVNNADVSLAELAAPVLEWWELYNPNGFDTLTAVISNPNDVSIDVTYDVVYYKDGKETARNEAFYNSDILPGHKDIIWANYDIPKSTDADDVRLENVTVSQAYYAPIDGKYEYVGTTDGTAWFDFEFAAKPTLATITFLLYNDDNKNGEFDKGEIVVTSSASLMEQKGRVSFATDVFAYTDYEVFFTAY